MRLVVEEGAPRLHAPWHTHNHWEGDACIHISRLSTDNVDMVDMVGRHTLHEAHEEG